MKTYTVLWTYVGNHSDCPTVVEAESPEEAIEKISFYDPEACNFIVIEGVPVLETARSVTIPGDDGDILTSTRKKVRIDYQEEIIINEMERKKKSCGYASIGEKFLE